MKILVVQQKMIGDVLLSTVLCANLKKQYPSAHIHYLIYPHTLPVVLHHPAIEKVILYEKEYQSVPGMFRFARQIKKEKYDIIIDAYSKLGTAIITALSGAGMTVGFYKSYLKTCYKYTVDRKAVAVADIGHVLSYRLALVERVAQLPPEIIKTPKIYLTDEEVTEAIDTLQKAGAEAGEKPIMISLLGSSESKSYPAAYMAAVLETVAAKTNAGLLLNYTPQQEVAAKEIIDLCSEFVRSRMLSVQPKGLRSFIAILSQCAVIIGNEGGAINIGKALGLPTFSIFSPGIKSGEWDLEKDDVKHVSVHPADFLSLDGKIKLKNKALINQLYSQFKPALFDDRLTLFLRNCRLTNKSKVN